MKTHEQHLTLLFCSIILNHYNSFILTDGNESDQIPNEIDEGNFDSEPGNGTDIFISNHLIICRVLVAFPKMYEIVVYFVENSSFDKYISNFWENKTFLQ